MTNTRDYPGLDLVRLSAAALVALYHLLFWWWLPTNGDRPDLLAVANGNPLIASAWVGVPIFFILSGFVIAFTADGRTARTFVRNRALRLYPAALLCATTTLVVAGGSAAAYASSVLLLPTGNWISGVYWTLPIEIAFYLLVALCLRLRIPIPSLALVLGFVSGSYWFLRALDGLVGKPIRPFFELIEGVPWGSLTLLTNGCYFAIGMALWSFAAGRASRLHLPMLVQCFWAALLALAVNARSYNNANGVTLSTAWPIGLWLIALGLIVASIVWNEAIAQFVRGRRGTLRWAGLVTYPLYLVHSEVGRDIALGSEPRIGSAASLMLALVSAAVIATLLALVEARLRALIERWLGLPNKAVASTDLP